MKIAVLDIETTDFFKRGGLILEIGITTLDTDTGEIKIIYNELLREESFGPKHENSWIFNNSDLTYKEMSDAQPLDIEKIQKIFDKYHVTAFNKDFDFEFLRDRGLIIKKELPCPMKLMTDVCKLPFKYGVRPPFIPNNQKYKWPKVQEAWDHIKGKTDYIEKHRGADDAAHEAEIVYWLIKNGIMDISNLASNEEEGKPEEKDLLLSVEA